MKNLWDYENLKWDNKDELCPRRILAKQAEYFNTNHYSNELQLIGKSNYDKLNNRFSDSLCVMDRYDRYHIRICLLKIDYDLFLSDIKIYSDIKFILESLYEDGYAKENTSQSIQYGYIRLNDDQNIEDAISAAIHHDIHNILKHLKFITE